MSPRRRWPAVLAAVAAGLALGACARGIAGEPRPAAHPTTAATQAGERSIEDVDPCTLLTLDDLPVRPVPGGRAEQRRDLDGSGCASAIQLANPLEVLAASVGRWPVPFRYYRPLPGHVGSFVEIGGRPAWVGRDGPGGATICGASFGSAGIQLTVAVADSTGRGVDSCDTATELAEIVIARTPPPDEP